MVRVFKTPPLEFRMKLQCAEQPCMETCKPRLFVFIGRALKKLIAVQPQVSMTCLKDLDSKSIIENEKRLLLLLSHSEGCLACHEMTHFPLPWIVAQVGIDGLFTQAGVSGHTSKLLRGSGFFKELVERVEGNLTCWFFFLLTLATWGQLGCFEKNLMVWSGWKAAVFRLFI